MVCGCPCALCVESKMTQCYMIYKSISPPFLPSGCSYCNMVTLICASIMSARYLHSSSSYQTLTFPAQAHSQSPAKGPQRAFPYVQNSRTPRSAVELSKAARVVSLTLALSGIPCQRLGKDLSQGLELPYIHKRAYRGLVWLTATCVCQYM